MARAEFDRVGKRFGDTAALDDFNLTVADGELVAVLGPSGCGKSTLLRLAAGLESLTEGAIRLDGRRIDDTPPQQRDVAMVFQSYALYPHMTVRGNIEFPLRMRGMARMERRRRAQEVAALLELDELLERPPAQLSGGQRQRVALARALVRHPALFLLDEPLSNLDARLRLSVRQYIREVQRRLRVTTLYVTHDQTEAMTLGDRIVVMNRGRIQQVDTPVVTYERPANAFVAGFIGSPPMNLLPAKYADGVITIGDQPLSVPIALRERLARHAGSLTVGVRPEAFDGAAADIEGSLLVTPDPATAESLGSETLVRTRLGAHEVTVRCFGVVREFPRRLAAPFDRLHLFAGDDGVRVGP
jgi:multiple sugar transport system ATP-binding protein